VVRSLAQRLEKGGVVPCDGIDPVAQPFLAVLLRHLFPKRPIVVVTENLKLQERFQQDIETWLRIRSREPAAKDREPGDNPQPSTLDLRLLFFPAWEDLPHQPGLPHADVISDRLETLVTLSGDLELESHLATAAGALRDRKSPTFIVTSVVALLQRTFAPAALRSRTRSLRRGQRLDPRQLMEWLDKQGYETEAQVTQKGEMALRGGILDVFPLTSRWPVRLEFFGDELESLRSFDPLTQISREEITGVTLPPGGEWGILKEVSGVRCQVSGQQTCDSDSSHLTPDTPHLTPFLGTLLDYLPGDTIFLMADPEELSLAADEYERQVPRGDPFFTSWNELLAKLDHQGMSRVEAKESQSPEFTSLDAYRPLTERTPEQQIADAQRREFFNQLHRWLRQDYRVHVFCNNEG
jgi:transcription-repair coupling factor (superfamily II helicase)